MTDMADHFAAFSFVDRITEFDPGRRARGTLRVPADIAAFPSCLVAEAVGQLAAWVAMAHIDFRGRPVAALANETRFLARRRARARRSTSPSRSRAATSDAVAYAGLRARRRRAT